jgi:hypothetical protein
MAISVASDLLGYHALAMTNASPLRQEQISRLKTWNAWGTDIDHLAKRRHEPAAPLMPQ